MMLEKKQFGVVAVINHMINFSLLKKYLFYDD
jgi:hypothetical protein